jgi:hypothetical protein
MISVKNYSNLVKDPNSGGIINSDPKAYLDYKAKREIALRKINEKKATEDRILSIEKDINKLKSDISDIKSMISTIVEKII